MGKPTSSRPKPSKTVQTPPSVQKEVGQRIVELRNLGMGCRKISKRLEEEGLAVLSKSTVANYLDQAQAQIRIAAKKLPKDSALRSLTKAEAKLQKQVDQIQMRRQAQQRVRDLQLQKAETSEGLKDIFKNNEKLTKFMQQTLYDSQTLKDFEHHCEANSLPLAKTLSNAIGSLEKYETENEDMFWPDLSSYGEEQLYNYLIDEEKKRNEEQIQKTRILRLLAELRACGKCDAPYYVHKSAAKKI